MRILLILSLLFGSPATSQVYEISDEYWDDEYIPILESTESILFEVARWEPVGAYSETTRIRQLAQPVGRLRIRRGLRASLCTGFLISPSIIMTNNHCIPGSSTPSAAAIEFGILRQFGNTGAERYEVSLPPIYTNAAMDFSLLFVDGRPGDTWGALQVDFRELVEGEALQVFHHPAGQPMRLSRVGCMAGPQNANIPTGFFLHQCDTLGGSSGAPVLSEDGTVVGIHHRGTIDRGFDAFNQGTMSRFFQNAVDEYGQVLQEVIAVDVGGDGDLSALRRCADEARLILDESALLDCISLIEE